jgi:hypothetical protein
VIAGPVFHIQYGNLGKLSQMRCQGSASYACADHDDVKRFSHVATFHTGTIKSMAFATWHVRKLRYGILNFNDVVTPATAVNQLKMRKNEQSWILALAGMVV